MPERLTSKLIVPGTIEPLAAQLLNLGSTGHADFFAGQAALVESYFQLGSYETALSLSNELLPLIKESSHLPDLTKARLLHRSALCALYSGDSAKADRDFGSAETVLVKTRDHLPVLIEIYSDHAQALIERGDSPAALLMLQRASQLAEQGASGGFSAIGDVYEKLGIFEAKNGHESDASEYFEKAAAHTGSLSSAGIARRVERLWNAATLKSQLDNYDDAARLLNAALGFAAFLSVPTSAIQIRRDLALVHGLNLQLRSAAEQADVFNQTFEEAGLEAPPRYLKAIPFALRAAHEAVESNLSMAQQFFDAARQEEQLAGEALKSETRATEALTLIKLTAMDQRQFTIANGIHKLLSSAA